jgi:hypothetical protein
MSLTEKIRDVLREARAEQQKIATERGGQGSRHLAIVITELENAALRSRVYDEGGV